MLNTAQTSNRSLSAGWQRGRRHACRSGSCARARGVCLSAALCPERQPRSSGRGCWAVWRSAGPSGWHPAPTLLGTHPKSRVRAEPRCAAAQQVPPSVTCSSSHKPPRATPSRLPPLLGDGADLLPGRRGAAEVGRQAASITWGQPAPLGSRAGHLFAGQPSPARGRAGRGERLRPPSLCGAALTWAVEMLPAAIFVRGAPGAAASGGWPVRLCEGALCPRPGCGAVAVTFFAAACGVGKRRPRSLRHVLSGVAAAQPGSLVGSVHSHGKRRNGGGLGALRG